jgi:hypothetical protein
MKTIATLRLGSAILYRGDLSQMAMSPNARLLISDRVTWQAIRKSISSRVLVDGRSLRVLQDGPTLAPCGPEVVPANPSASLASKRAKRTRATSGQNSSASLPPAAPMSLWESRLRQRLANLGSMECVLTWKESVTPQGRPLSRLVPSTRPTAGTDCGLWPTTKTGSEESLESWEQRKAPEYQKYPGKGLGSAPLNVLAKAMWATARSCSAMARDWRSDRGQQTSEELYGAKGRPLPRQVYEALGEKPLGSVEQTEKPGALNPEFVSWLMGFPPEWVNCAPSAMPSSRKSRRKSSGPISIAPPPY